jgi:hypothetical protein
MSEATNQQRVGETCEEWVKRCGAKTVQEMLRREYDKYGVGFTSKKLAGKSKSELVAILVGLSEVLPRVIDALKAFRELQDSRDCCTCPCHSDVFLCEQCCVGGPIA